jgi:hypothetical protein
MLDATRDVVVLCMTYERSAGVEDDGECQASDERIVFVVRMACGHSLRNAAFVGGS